MIHKLECIKTIGKLPLSEILLQLCALNSIVCKLLANQLYGDRIVESFKGLVKWINVIRVKMEKYLKHELSSNELSFILTNLYTYFENFKFFLYMSWIDVTQQRRIFYNQAHWREVWVRMHQSITFRKRIWGPKISQQFNFGPIFSRKNLNRQSS